MRTALDPFRKNYKVYHHQPQVLLNAQLNSPLLQLHPRNWLVPLPVAPQQSFMGASALAELKVRLLQQDLRAKRGNRFWVAPLNSNFLRRRKKITPKKKICALLARWCPVFSRVVNGQGRQNFSTVTAMDTPKFKPCRALLRTLHAPVV
jgi:hypothetical protein